MTQLGESGTMKASGVRALWMEMISLLWSLFLWSDLFLDCLYNPQRSIILHTLLKSAKEAAYMKIINPERRVLNMYNALVVILSNLTPPKRRKVAFEGYFVWGREVACSSICSCQVPWLSKSHSGLLVTLFLPPDCYVCLQWNNFQMWF